MRAKGINYDTGFLPDLSRKDFQAETGLPRHGYALQVKMAVPGR
ncbi:hypothetical protein ACFSKW_41770 [Nonomuraea mangrovi]|uniref:Uncharacterized protein n=1 Tax=Nonomuraea mangrovi TaxID=2316207 RepID=A0ABW4T9F9_9ACTN